VLKVKETITTMKRTNKNKRELKAQGRSPTEVLAKKLPHNVVGRR
jgi:hypothetical protein